MKKTIQKPENWQDFETLCKKLWGEVWGIPSKIKKNGRNGQPQAGVDIYGIPKGESMYWGIQCKGKDDYSNAELSTTEIENEIIKAQAFNPTLGVFIFATTMNKDAELEEFVRIRDLENRGKGSFEILLFCWEDIADLIDENRDTYNFYVGNKQHKSRHELTIHLKGFKQQHTIRPVCIRRVKKYMAKPEPDDNYANAIIQGATFRDHYARASMSGHNFLQNLERTIVNESICPFDVIMENTGTMVLEDWSVTFRVSGKDGHFLNKDTSNIWGAEGSINQSEEINVQGNEITYAPGYNRSLIQKDKQGFQAYIIPNCKEYIIPIEWHLLARDFDANGTIYLKVEPYYQDEPVYALVEDPSQIRPDEILSVRHKKYYA